jgi:hypothetical protein
MEFDAAIQCMPSLSVLSASHLLLIFTFAHSFRVNRGTWWSGGAPGSTSAPFDAPFYIILNLAIGGNWPGNNIAPGPHVMLVDWVRVWRN